MHPAYSVIFFTSLSGAGYGLLIWLALSRLAGAPVISAGAGFVWSILALVLVTAGLLSSSLHLGHPERAWRAFSQWRSSWLSREGVLAVVTYLPAVLFTGSWVGDWLPPQWLPVTALLTAAMSMLTVICTGMIYASLKPVPRWNNQWVVPIYLALALASGGLLFVLTTGGQASNLELQGCLAVLLMAWLMKWRYWRFIDRQTPSSTTGTATGLESFGEVRQLEAPHTSENYLLREMGYVIARKHATRLRRYSAVLGLIVPGALLLLALAVSGVAQIAMLSAALMSGITGIILERWLFFAEARHAVTLYYGRSL